MQEVQTSGLVLSNESLGELDRRVAVFTEDFGKIKAKIKSGSKPVSKLNGHLQPGNFVKIRLIHVNGNENDFYQIIEASSYHSFIENASAAALIESLTCLNLIENLMPPAMPDPILWDFVLEFDNIEDKRKELLLKIGFDIDNEKCAACSKRNPLLFDTINYYFVCQECNQLSLSTTNILRAKNQFIKIK